MKRKLLLLFATICTISSEAQWQQILADPSMGAGQVVALNKDTAFVSVNANLLLKTTDGGLSWDTSSFTNAGTYNMHFVDHSTGFVSGMAAFITGPTFFKTSDCGITWQPMNFSAGAPYFNTDVFFLDKDTGFVTDGSTVAKTTDGGNNFQILNVAAGDKINDIYFKDHHTGFAAVLHISPGSSLFTENHIYKTSDQGATWVLVHSDNDMGNNSFVFAGIIEIFFVNDSFGIAVGGEGKMLKTTDGGNTWINVPNNLNDYDISDVEFLTEQEGYICYAGKIYYTGDGMQTWIKQADSSHDYYAVDMVDKHLGYAAGHGIFKTSNGGGLTSVSAPYKHPLFISIYPNPATEQVVLQYEDLLIHEIKLMDISGKVVRQYPSSVKVLDIRGISQGIYLLKIGTDKGNKMERLLIR